MALRLVSLALCALAAGVTAFDNSRYDNVAVYWGQNSIGAVGAPASQWQKPLSFYCNDNAVDVFPIAFVNVFFSTGGLPSMNLANTCNAVDNATFPGTALPNCQALAADIQTCQAKGKLITLSLGGATAGVGFQTDAQAVEFANTIWNLFLGGSSSTRPFGKAVLDGVDLELSCAIEGGGGSGYIAFVNKIRSLSSGASKKYYITAAPQCVYPDAALSTVLNAASFDAIYVQFYNNPCSLPNFNSVSQWNFGIWDQWAKTISPNPNVKVYIGAPASTTAAGSGFVDIATLSSIAVKMRKSFSSFGGVMLWDASQAFQNNRFDLAIKNALVAAGGTGFTFPACSAAAWSASGTYPGGSQVSFQGYIWQAKWFASGQPAVNPNSDWSAISACGGAAIPPTSTTTTTTTSRTTTTPTTSPTTSRTSTTTSKTTTSAPSNPTGGSCAGVAAWVGTAAYEGGSKVTFNSHLWTAQWWTFNDTPGGSAGVWVDNGACSSAKVVVTANAKATARANSRFFL
ncbi:Glycoside hydrolase family 18 protein [Mycena kentingensis (nom. inval.)]|nr:Glycoside hydrolase family 18 protein [Mycena kentingensis (nom. inval.)]